jgi:cytochrome subunit of sulfide dehydrogenase
MEIDFIAILRPTVPAVAKSMLFKSVCLVFGCALAGPALADVVDARALAATCASCHQPGQPTPPALVGQAREELLAKLDAFRNGTRAGTVMPQLARGYTRTQLEAIAAWYSAQPPTK